MLAFIFVLQQLTFIGWCKLIFIWFHKFKKKNCAVFINHHQGSCTCLLILMKSWKRSWDLRYNYFPTGFIKTHKWSTGKTSCYCPHRGIAGSSLYYIQPTQKRNITNALNEENVLFIIHILLDIRESNHKTHSSSKLGFLSLAAHSSASLYIPIQYILHQSSSINATCAASITRLP